MAHEEIRTMSKRVDAKVERLTEEKQSLVDELADANHEIEDLKLQVAWLERNSE